MTKVIIALVIILLLACAKNTNQPQMVSTKFADNYIAPTISKNTNAHRNQSNGKHSLLAFAQNSTKTTLMPKNFYTKHFGQIHW